MPSDTHSKTVTRQNSSPDLPIILVIDDDIMFQQQVRFILSGRYLMRSALKADADDLFTDISADTIILDLNMPGVDGVSFIKTIATLDPKPKLLIASGHDLAILELAKTTAIMYGLFQTEILQKPLNKTGLLRALAQLDRMPAAHDYGNIAPRVFSDDDIHAGFVANQFTAHYQPQVSIVSAEVTGLEALARWDHPDFGRLSPASFIDQIENSQYAVAFTLFIAEKAVQDTLQLELDTGIALKVSVNVPPRVLESETLIEELTRILEHYDFPAHRFQCEITERGLENPDPVILTSIARLRMKGVQFSIDDFGIGQSGLSKLKSQAFDEVKIDRSFINDLSSSKGSRSIVESIIQLSRLVGFRIVAEGVEDKLTLKHSRILGIQNVQGYYFAKPMAATALAQWITEWNSQGNKSREKNQ
ncbi:MAG: EAL domain-containing response regulator [Pseudohongiella sp.]|nr:EAL domain-containing response regulator [Pseudohongiella sp.]MDO9519097.1 EAL domain-containing response regulator [Pseudohongiella sp.]MDP2129102.1 EAL domain-containing response regulator [Pseudohongiella sp.]